MKKLTLIVAWLLACTLASAQRQKLTINAETPEGQLLQQIGQESDESKKLALLEQFAAKYPKHEGAAWVYGQMVTAYTKADQFDKAMDAGDKLLAIDPGDLEIAHQALKAAEAKKDPDAVIKWAVKTSDLARKVAQSPKPKDEDEAEDWKRNVAFAKQLDVYTEYSLYALALQTTDPRKKLALADALEQRNPQSQYLPQLGMPRFIAYLQAGENQKAVALAEKTLEKDQSSEEMLLAVAESYMTQNKEPDKVLAYCAKVLELVKTKPKPEGVSDADWETRKTQLSGRAGWMTGVIYATQSKWAEADQALRAALPAIKGDPRMAAAALFYLGVANFRLGEKADDNRIVEALRFSEQCAAIAGPFQGPARTNIRAIKAKYQVK
jgi:tetratricopeptide (TPR) repeat protein